MEISGIYKKNGKVRRIHNLIFSPNIKIAEEINSQLGKIGNLKSDGRPILGLDSERLAEIIFNINSEAAIIPAHAWTPWFSIFGSMSGFDSIEECFGKYADKIFAIETGLSSDPAMNWQLSKLDNIALISNSDSHSLEKIGREANIFDTKLSYKGIIDAIKSGAPKFVATIEFFPEEGKYHYDGHRNCDVIFHPDETAKHNGICPVCKKPLVIGVMNRVAKLADKKNLKIEIENNIRKYDDFTPYYNLVALRTIIAEAFAVGPTSKKVKAEYEKLVKIFGNELKILMETDYDDLNKFLSA